jgi:hypothetical protein
MIKNVAEELVQMLDKVVEGHHIGEYMKELDTKLPKPHKPTTKDARRGNSMSPKEFGQLKRR